MSQLDACSLVAQVAAQRVVDIVSGNGQGVRSLLALVGFPVEQTAAIGYLLKERHPTYEIAVNGDARANAVAHRNRRPAGFDATIISIPLDELTSVEQSLGHVTVVGEPALLAPSEASNWASVALHSYTANPSAEILSQLCHVIKGLLESEVANSATMVGTFVSDVVNLHAGKAGLPIADAVRQSMHVLQLVAPPLDGKSKSTAASPLDARRYFTRARTEFRPYLDLQTPDGKNVGRDNVLKRIEEDAAARPDDADARRVREAVRRLVEDRTIRADAWSEAKEAVASFPWEQLEPFFAERRSKPTPSKLGEETLAFFDDEYPGELTDAEKELIAPLKSETSKAAITDEVRDFFARHRDRIKDKASLLKRWQRLIFRKEIEDEDLLSGLLRLAERVAIEGADHELADPVLHVRLTHGEKKSFWTETQNTSLCRNLRDRYRGLQDALGHRVALDFGRCWDPRLRWDDKDLEEVTSTSKVHIEFQFEGFLVERNQIAGDGAVAKSVLSRAPAGKLIWMPPVQSIVTAFAADLAAHVPSRDGEVFIMEARASAVRGKTGRKVAELRNRSTIVGSFRSGDGTLFDPDREDTRIDKSVEAAISKLKDLTILSPADADEIAGAWARFADTYRSALKNFVYGSGLSSPLLLHQADVYGELLEILAAKARAPKCRTELWKSILRIGTARITADMPSVIITPWHPLRLAEMAAKASQCGNAISTIISDRVRNGMSDFVERRVSGFGQTYYPDICFIDDESGSEPSLGIEVEKVGDYGLLQSPVVGAAPALLDDTAEDAVKAFEEVSERYLELRPHEKDHFSTAIYNADSAELPSLLADALGQKVATEHDFRCELTIMHDDPDRLHRIYREQNERIGRELAGALTTEATRTYLSRLRVGFLSSSPLAGCGRVIDVKPHDLVLLQDTISRLARVAWRHSSEQEHADPPTWNEHIPTDVGRRKPFLLGDVSSCVYLTSPSVPPAAQAYVDRVHDLLKSDDARGHWLPLQEINIASPDVKGLLNKAHQVADWVVTFDRIADRRLLQQSETQERRIIRYFTSPGSDHNVIVSTTVGVDEIAKLLQDHLQPVLPGKDEADRMAIGRLIQRESTDLSGEIVMRAVQIPNSALELIGLVLARRQVELLLNQDECKICWFFIDEVARWLDLNNERSDILAVSFTSKAGQRFVRMVVIESKYVGSPAFGGAMLKSKRQLASTYDSLRTKFVDIDEVMSPEIWRHRLADMLVEHFTPFEHVAGFPYERWIEEVRNPSGLRIELSGHSMVFQHDEGLITSEVRIDIDEDKPAAERRPLVQWLFGKPQITGMLLNLDNTAASPAIGHPTSSQATLASPMTEEMRTPKADVAPEVPALQRPRDERDGAILQSPRQTAERAEAAVDRTPTSLEAGPADVPAEPAYSPTPETVSSGRTGWLPEVETLALRLATHSSGQDAQAKEWLDQQVSSFRQSLQVEGATVEVQKQWLTPNAGLLRIKGSKSLTIDKLEKQRTNLKTIHGLDIIRITAELGSILIAFRRPSRTILHLADAWLRRTLSSTAPESNLAFLLGEKEDDGEMLYMPVTGPFNGQPQVAPHTLIAGSTGSGKGILAANLILDLCAFDSPTSCKFYLIDPKQGADYMWAETLPHLQEQIIVDMDAASRVFGSLVSEMEERYRRITAKKCRNIVEYNRVAEPSERMPRLFVFHDEISDWMMDDDYRDNVTTTAARLGNMGRAAGIHLVLMAQRPDVTVMSMQLRNALGNRLILRLDDQKTSEIAMNEKGAERLLGQGHMIAKLQGLNENMYVQVPFLSQSDTEEFAAAIRDGWRNRGYVAPMRAFAAE
ncbi:FtsK/SpoIIIE domain-containing protein [Bradyrhizobium sp. Ec3.3]|uniref:FtsK/SpoIIIE domain-containing protein n=1 Tax=Bradyrhizobium sp. Ec3.3 TaxID=189753 RepID=UPI0003FDEC01|nr:FtsK/SpoIIIE domain-containing protein [Bradyrhizobium sp. Ec3.3]